ncbi:hypothetical protein KC19_5G114900 [Ceratodon purpureus]|uniref:Uncharacterized protein n=1 Tax=Ceratodon purpureus TaxID=3225 RepID=A0A8T0I0C5_CERPU|nr:hypothetical protein KC19_5G114900 [Ceratodon purpureus]
MSRLSIDDMFYGKPERVRYVAGGGSGSYGGYQAGPHYYSDGDDYYSHRHSGHSGRAPVYPSSVSGRPILPDVRLSVPMDTLRCVYRQYTVSSSHRLSFRLRRRRPGGLHG